MQGFFKQLMLEDGVPPEVLFYQLTIPRVIGWTIVGVAFLSLIGWATTPSSGIPAEAPRKKRPPRRGGSAPRESPQELIDGGMKSLEEGEFADATRKFETLLDLLESMGGGRPQDRLMIMSLLARSLMGEDKIVAAEEKCGEVISLLRRSNAPPSAFCEPNMLLAEIYFKTDRLQECESLCQKVISSLPLKKVGPNEREGIVYNLCSAHRQLAKVYIKQQKLDQAVENSRTALKLANETAPLSPMSANITLEMAAMLIDLGRPAEADLMIKQLLEDLERSAGRMDQTQVAGQIIDALVKALFLNFDRCRWTEALQCAQRLRDQLTSFLRIKSTPTIRQLMFMAQAQTAAIYREQIIEMKDNVPAESPEITEKEDSIKELENSFIAGIAELNCGAPLGNSKMLRCTMCTFKPSLGSYSMRIELKKQLPLKPGPHPYWLPAGALLEVHFENTRDPLSPVVSTRLVDHATVQARGRIELIQQLPFGAPPPQATATLKVAVYMYADSAKTKLLDVMQQYCRVGDDPNQYTPGIESA